MELTLNRPANWKRIEKVIDESDLTISEGLYVAAALLDNVVKGVGDPEVTTDVLAIFGARYGLELKSR